MADRAWCVRKSARVGARLGQAPHPTHPPTPKNQATRICGRSVRISAKSREIPPIARFGQKAHSWFARQINVAHVRNVQMSAKSMPDWGKRGQNQAARIRGRSVRIFAKSREIPPIARFGQRAFSWFERQINVAHVRNVQTSAKSRPDWGERGQNQATRIRGRSVRIFAKSRETPPVTRLGQRAHSWCGRQINVANVRNV